jgi:hypothetical protein
MNRTIIAFNGAGMAVYTSSSTATATCCDVYGNTGGDYVGGLNGQGGTNGNISEDPTFCDASAGDFTLYAGSPCLPENNSCEVTIGCFGQGCTATAVDDIEGDNLPAAFSLGQNHPNPFNPTTTIGYELPENARVSLVIYDVSGRLVRSLVDRENKPAGRYEEVWDGRDNTGNQVASGVYFYRISTPAFTRSKSMVLLK